MVNRQALKNTDFLALPDQDDTGEWYVFAMYGPTCKAVIRPCQSEEIATTLASQLNRVLAVHDVFHPEVKPKQE